MGKKVKSMTTNLRIRKLQRKQGRQSKKKRSREHDQEDCDDHYREEATSRIIRQREGTIEKSEDTPLNAVSTAIPVDTQTSSVSSRNKRPKKHRKDRSEIKDHLDYANLDSSIASELRKEDVEIADLEVKLGLANAKEKSRLHKEYAKHEGFGDDFGDFLDDLDNLVSRVMREGDDCEDKNSDDSYNENDNDFDDSSEPDEEAVPMKGDSFHDHDDPSIDSAGSNDQDDDDDDDVEQSNSDESQREDSEDDAIIEAEQDHNVADTYQPTDGEDIYGHSLTMQKEESKTTKYVPPHLRQLDDSQDRKEKLLMLKRLLNNALNRLSEDTLISVVQSVSKLYQDFPTSDVNESLWKNVYSAAVDRPLLMVGMIPIYIACLAGVHFRTGDSVQLGGHLIEHIIERLWVLRENESNKETKVTSNLILCVCYLYNFGLVHAVFMFDVIRLFIDSFSDLDIELLLIILSHSGQALRSDDPLALKEIVLSVQAKQTGTEQISSSRVDFMVSAIIDLKNNKRRKHDTVYIERTAKLRKLLGRIKAETERLSGTSCLRIRLQDILDVESKGRWWKIGASWMGNQFKHQSDDDQENPDASPENNVVNPSLGHDMEEEHLLQLAAKYRMNTDSRRALFCIIMGSADCEDAFEKLVRSGLLKNRSERDCVRVLMECCGNENHYNPFYSHLAARICDYQPQCKFTFQLAFWDMFKQWETVSQRKAVNLAKLLNHLVAKHQSLKLSVLKPLDMGELEDTALIFLVAFFSTIFDSIEDSSQVFHLFERGIPKPKPGQEEDSLDLRESLSVFFLQTLKSSPKNKPKSRFRSNLKAAMKACKVNELDLMLPSKDM